MTLDKDTVKRANPIERVIPELLGEHVLEVAGELKVRCPWHEDKRPSLRINAAKQVWHCDPCGKGGDVFTFVQDFQRVEFREALAWLADRNGTNTTMATTPEQPRILEKTYDYKDEQGVLLYQAIRYVPKDFRQRRPDGRGGWIWNLEGARRVLYRLPELQGREAVSIVEGEKDVDALWALGIPATCNVGGAGKWREEYSRQLVTAGVKRIREIPDNDAPGVAHAHRVIQSCVAAGLDGRLVSLPDVPQKGDVSDYLQTHSREDLMTLLKAAAPYEVPSPIEGVQAATDGGLELTALSDLLAEPDEVTEWLVEDRVPCGSVVLLAGKPKAGKSTLVRDLALQVSRGGRWLGWSCSTGPVWYLAFEDKRSEVKKHFRAMGATSDDAVRFVFKQPGEEFLPELHRWAAQEKPALIVVDTLQRLIRARDLNDYAEVTTKLTPLLTLSRQTGAALLLVHHAGKGDRTGQDAVLGSTALAGSVDNILLYNRTDRFRLLSSIQRQGPDLTETVVQFDESSGRVSVGQTREASELAEMRNQVLAALADSPEPLTEAELSKQVEGRTPLKRKALRELIGQGVTRSGRGVRKDPFRYSRSLVPSYMSEQENEKPKSAKTLDKQGSDSRSHDSIILSSSASGSEQETLALPPVTGPDEDVFRVA